MHQEGRDRDEHRERTMPEYLALRRGTIGVVPSFDYYLLPEDIPDEALEHPIVKELSDAAVDMTIIANVCTLCCSISFRACLSCIIGRLLLQRRAIAWRRRSQYGCCLPSRIRMHSSRGNG